MGAVERDDQHVALEVLRSELPSPVGQLEPPPCALRTGARVGELAHVPAPEPARVDHDGRHALGAQRGFEHRVRRG